MMDRTGEENSCVSIAEMSDPLRFAKSKLNFHPEPQQLPVFDPAIKRGILCCNRQWGKSTTLAALAVHRAWSLAPALILVVAPVVRQAYELILKIKGFLRELGVRTRQDGFNGVSLLLPNGSRIIAVPSDPDTIRGYSRVSMILIDEAARVSDDTFNAVTPAMARSNGVVWLMSTPKGRTGFFHALWSNGDPRWTRIHSTVADCSRISPEFLESERAAKPAADLRKTTSASSRTRTTSSSILTTSPMPSRTRSMHSTTIRPASRKPRRCITTLESISASSATIPRSPSSSTASSIPGSATRSPTSG